jgi:hypothetical protein
MPLLGFEHTISVFQRAKTVHDLDGAATVIGLQDIQVYMGINVHNSGEIFTVAVRISDCAATGFNNCH